MDYSQGVVADYLRADRSCFISPEFFLPNDLCEAEQDRKRYWYVDVLAIQMAERCAYLCEVTYAKSARALLQRLRLWRQHWHSVRQAVFRDAGVPKDWQIRPWVFVPEEFIPGLLLSLPEFAPGIKITPLEMTLPWKYRWDRQQELEKPDCIPTHMR